MSDNAKRSTANPLRDTSAKERLKSFLLGGVMWRLFQKFPRLQRLMNRYLINEAINILAPRPYRLSTKTDHTSWDTLIDKKYNTRELSPTQGEHLGTPAPGDVLKLFKRDEMIEDEKSTVLFAYVAQWFTDGFLRSDRSVLDDKTGEIKDRRDITKNESTHEVDLAQLYGLTPDVTTMLRDPLDLALLAYQLDANGEEYPPSLFDTDGRRVKQFRDLRVIGISRKDPEVTKPNVNKSDLLAMGSDTSNTQIGYAMLNTLFLREHNRIAREIRKAQKAAGEDWSDDRVFAATRSVLTVLLIKLVIEEYINHITPYHFQFRFDPQGFEKQRWHRPNWVAVEFNLLYRWHGLIPSTLEINDAKLKLDDTMFKTKSLLTARGLGPLFDDASKQHAGAIGLYNTGDELLQMAELPSIEAARTVRLRSYNDYRQHCKFPLAETFEEISSNPKIAKALSDTYDGKVDAVEFYVGLFAEDRRPNSVIPPMMGRLVGVHAFSQLMTNPLLSPAVYTEETFSERGMEIIDETESLKQVVERNVPKRKGGYHVKLTHDEWKRT